MGSRGVDSVPIGAPNGKDVLADAIHQIEEAAAAKKCWSCDCLRNTLNAINRGIPQEQQQAELAAAIAKASQRLVEPKYDCLGCEVCYPALAVNALNQSPGLMTNRSGGLPHR